MKVSGFTIVRNAVKFDYPVVESIKSVLPLCDEFVVAVGQSEDETLQLVQSIGSSKIKIVKTVWDDSLREGGRVLAAETDKALEFVSPDCDWAFYIQADEVIHERDYKAIREAMQTWQYDMHVDGLLLNYFHFYGSYNYVADAYNWYRKEIRIIRKRDDIHSYGDAQGFRKAGNKKLHVKPVDAYIYHYGWVKHPAAQQRKQESFHKMWHDDNWMDKNVVKADEYDYNTIDSLRVFDWTHPAIMRERVAAANWHFEFDTSKSRMKLKYRIRRWLEETFGINVGEYRNYKLI